MYKSSVIKNKKTGNFEVYKFEKVELSLEDLQQRKSYLLADIQECNRQMDKLKQWNEMLQNELSQVEQLISQEISNQQ